jgi:hypothetical protein
MNKKAAFGILSIIFSLIIFLILWAMFFGGWLNVWAANMISINNLTGIEAFLISYINLWVGVGVLIGSFVMIYFGGRQ